MTFPRQAVIYLLKVLSTKFGIVIGRPRCTLTLPNILKAAFLVDAAKGLTDRLRCLPGTDRSPDRFKLLQWISSSTSLSRTGNRFILSVIDHLTRFLILIPIRSK